MSTPRIKVWCGSVTGWSWVCSDPHNDGEMDHIVGQLCHDTAAEAAGAGRRHLRESHGVKP